MIIQFVAFGDGERAPLGSMYNTIPSHIVKQINNLGHAQIPYMCFGVYGRSGEDEHDWDDDDEQEVEHKQANSDSGSDKDTEEEEEDDEEILPLSEWEGEQIVTTRCTNAKAVIEWVFVPYVVEDDSEEDNEQVDKEENADGNDEL
jgi:hypothetical protein